MTDGIGAEAGASATGNLRPHCQNAAACPAKKPTSHCRRCWGLHLRAHVLNDETEDKRLETVRAHASDTAKRRWEDPEYRAMMVAGARARNTLGRPEIVARSHAPEVRARAVAARQRTLDAMSADERKEKYGRRRNTFDGLSGADLETYRALRAKKIPAVEARAMVVESARHVVRRAAAEQRARQEREKAQAY